MQGVRAGCICVEVNQAMSSQVLCRLQGEGFWCAKIAAARTVALCQSWANAAGTSASAESAVIAAS